MVLKLSLFVLADIWMIATGFIYGWKLLKKRNYLLGIEWAIMGTSGTNFLIFTFTQFHPLFTIAYFFDAFSRAFGFTVIVIAGLMTVTHKYKPSVLADSVYFVLSFLAAFVLVAYDHALASIKPWFYVVMATVLSIYLVYFAWRLLRAGEKGHAWGVISVTVVGQLIASIYDFYHLPGDDEAHTIFYIFALTVWGFYLFELYYAYCALERAERTAPSGARSTNEPQLI